MSTSEEALRGPDRGELMVCVPLSSLEEAWLAAEAARQGISSEDLAAQLCQQQLSRLAFEGAREDDPWSTPS